MDKEKVFFYIMEQYKYPVVFVDTEHTIRFMNKIAAEKYEKRGLSNLVGSSIFSCHNDRSNGLIEEYYKRFIEGENEIVYPIVNKANQRITMVAVRDNSGKLLGYYERFEDIEPK